MKGFAGQLQEAFPGLHIFVKEIENRFFGETITVSGLITGKDLTEQLLESRDQGEKLGDTLLIPENMLRMGEQVFLDDMTLQEAEEKLGMRNTRSSVRRAGILSGRRWIPRTAWTGKMTEGEPFIFRLLTG